MTQAQIQAQTQTSSDLSTLPLLNDSSVLFLETLDQTNTNNSNTIEHTTSSKVHTRPDNTNETPPPRKKRRKYECPLFLSSHVFPPAIPSKPSLPTNHDDHLIFFLSQDNFIFNAQLTPLYMHTTDNTFRLYDKNQDFSTFIGSKISYPYQY